jgi:hypothetical protein
MKNNDFYIGWSAKAPATYIGYLRRFLFILIALLLLGCALLALLQRKASAGILETSPIRLSGIFHSLPVPNLRIALGKNADGESLFKIVPLLGQGKAGPNNIIRKWQRNGTFEDSLVTLVGVLLYNDGKDFLQLDDDDSALRPVTSATSIEFRDQRPIELGMATLKGEIADPKCFFGVMKPGEGKPHRDCAVRCILGGVPPVVVTRDTTGRANYYLLLGPNGESMNRAVQDYVAEPISIYGRLVRYDDWIVCYAADSTSITRLSYLDEHFGKEVVSCGGDCRK